MFGARCIFGGGRRTEPAVVFESLEDRTLMSAASHVQPIVATPVVSALHQPPASAAPAKKASSIPTCSGTWKGTFTVNGSTTVYNFTAKVVSQKGVAVVVDFTGLAAMIGVNSWRTTMILDTAHNVRAILQGKNVEAGFTAAISANAAQIYGKWCALGTTGGFKTGMLTLNKA